MAPLFGVAITTLNRRALFEDTLDAVYRYSPPGTPIIVVDDGAATEFLKAKPETWYQSVAEPFCFARGLKPFCFSRNVNLGIRAAGDDDVIILNDDALLQSHRGFGSLAYVANANPQYGIIAASCDTVGNANQNRRGGIGRTLQPRDEPRMVCFV